LTNGSGQGALKIKRSVEMYQWTETSTSNETKTLSGATTTTTTYNYDATWSSSLIDSTQFRQQNDNTKNPTSFPFDSLVLEADPIFLANLIEVSTRVIDRFNWYEPVSVALDDVPDALRANLTVYTNSGFYYGGSNNGTLSASAVGDVRITFEAVESDIISIVAQVKKVSASSNSNSNYSLDSYTTSRGSGLLLVKRGTFTSEELFIKADEDNTTLAWMLRGVGFLLMFVSILLVLQPLATAVDVIPFVGDYLRGGLEKCIFPTIALLIAVPVSHFVVVLAWIAYSPFIAVPILVVSFVLTVCLCIRARKAKQNDDENNNGNSEDLMLELVPDSSSSHIKPQSNADVAAYSTLTGVASGGEGFSSALDQPASSALVAEPDIKL
jgi:hypothetical protein